MKTLVPTRNLSLVAAAGLLLVCLCVSCNTNKASADPRSGPYPPAPTNPPVTSNPQDDRGGAPSAAAGSSTHSPAKPAPGTQVDVSPIRPAEPVQVIVRTNITEPQPEKIETKPVQPGQSPLRHDTPDTPSYQRKP